MTLDPVSLSQAAPTPAADFGTRTPAAGGASFGGLLDNLLGGATESYRTADAAVRDLAVGNTDSLHGVMLQLAQADLSFRLVLEIRNRLTEAYQEVMKMQV